MAPRPPVYLITGANAGIGRETALALARQGATVVMVARNRERGEAALSGVRAESGNADVHLLLADLSSQRQVRALAEAFKARFDRLDALINNAGVVIGRRTLTEDGVEMTFAVNHLAPFLLTHLLLDTLKASAPARVVTVASEAHRRAGRLDFANLQGERRYNDWGAYSASKLANILFTYELARRLEGTGVTANCLHPGLVRTDLAYFGSAIVRLVWRVITPMMISPRKAAETPVYLASSPEVEGVSGQYFSDKRPRRSSDASYDEAAQRELWRVSERLTGLADVAPR